jgi:site-specific DNA recombinase
MKVGIFVRVSTDEQAKNGNSIDAQIQKGQEVCKYLNIKEHEIYLDAGVSGLLPIEERPKFNQLLKDIQSGKIQGIVVSAFDRLTRSETNWPKIRNILSENKAKLILEGVDIDYDNYDVNMMMSLKNIFATHEVSRLKFRSKQGIRAGVEKGRVGGGLSIPYGYKKGVDKMMIIDEEESDVVKMIFRLAIEGKGQRAIATILNDKKIETRYQKQGRTLMVNGVKRTKFVWKDGTVYSILINSIYVGRRKFKNELLPYNENIRIVSDDMFEAIKRQFQKNKQFNTTTSK